MYSTTHNNPKSISEVEHLHELQHFQTKFDRSKHFKKTPDEKEALAKAMHYHPTKNHSPLNEL
jgi:phosphopantetheinyl transferase (holo-ACP synthase)